MPKTEIEVVEDALIAIYNELLGHIEFLVRRIGELQDEIKDVPPEYRAFWRRLNEQEQQLNGILGKLHEWKYPDKKRRVSKYD